MLLSMFKYDYSMHPKKRGTFILFCGFLSHLLHMRSKSLIFKNLSVFFINFGRFISCDCNISNANYRGVNSQNQQCRLLLFIVNIKLMEHNLRK